MERIKVYKVNKLISWFFVVLGAISFLAGTALLITYLIEGFNTKFPGSWNSVIQMVQGAMFFLLGYIFLRSDKYYIEWDDKEIRFLLPDCRSPETIKFSEVESIRVKLFEIVLKLHDRTRILNLESTEIEDLRKIKIFFENYQDTR